MEFARGDVHGGHGAGQPGGGEPAGADLEKAAAGEERADGPVLGIEGDHGHLGVGDDRGRVIAGEQRGVVALVVEHEVALPAGAGDDDHGAVGEGEAVGRGDERLGRKRLQHGGKRAGQLGGARRGDPACDEEVHQLRVLHRRDAGLGGDQLLASLRQHAQPDAGVGILVVDVLGDDVIRAGLQAADVHQVLEAGAGVVEVAPFEILRAPLGVVVERADGDIGPGQRAGCGRRPRAAEQGELSGRAVQAVVVLAAAHDVEEVHHVAAVGGAGHVHHHERAAIGGGLRVGAGAVGGEGAGERPVGKEPEVAGGIGGLAVGVDRDGVVRDGGLGPGEDAGVELIGAVGIAQVGRQVLAVGEEVELQAVVVVVGDMQPVEEPERARVGGIVEQGVAVAAEDAGRLRRHDAAGAGRGLGREGRRKQRLEAAEGLVAGGADAGQEPGVARVAVELQAALVGEGVAPDERGVARAAVAERRGELADRDEVERRVEHPPQPRHGREVVAELLQQLGGRRKDTGPDEVVVGRLVRGAIAVDEVVERVVEADAQQVALGTVEHLVDIARVVAVLADDGELEQGALVRAVVAAHLVVEVGVDGVLEVVGLDARADLCAGLVVELLQHGVGIEGLPDVVVGLGQAGRDLVGLPDEVDDLARVTGALGGHELAEARLLLVVHRRVDLGDAVEEDGGLVGVEGIAGEQVGAAQDLRAGDEAAAVEARALPDHVVGMRDEPVALAVGADPAPAIVHDLPLQEALVLESAAVIRAVVVVGVDLAADRALDLERLAGIDDPRVGGAVDALVDFPPVDGAAGVAELDGPRDLGGGHKVVQVLVAPRRPVLSLLEDLVGKGAGGGVARDIGAGLGDLGVGVERAGGLERELRRAHLLRQEDVVRDLRLDGAVGKPRVAGGGGRQAGAQRERGGEQAGQGGAHGRHGGCRGRGRQSF